MTGRPSPGGGASRVAHLINTAEVGGGAEHLIRLARGLEAHGWGSAVLVGRGGPAVARLRAAGATVEIVGPLGPTAPFGLARRLTALKPALVHLHGSRAGLLGAWAARAARIRPVIYTAHMFSFRRRLPPGLRWAAARAESLTASLVDSVICVSESDRAEAIARGLSPARLVVVPNGIEIERFPAASDRRAELDIASGAPVIGMVGRLVSQKDPLTFARMACRVAEAAPTARFLVVGDGPLKATLENEARALTAGRRLIVTGFRDDVPELLATMDVVVFPSLWEAQGIALIEAMAAARAVVATALPAHAEAIVDGESGLLVPLRDPARLAAAILELLADPERRAALGRSARSRSEQRYRVERMIEETAAVYRAVRAAGA